MSAKLHNLISPKGFLVPDIGFRNISVHIEEGVCYILRSSIRVEVFLKCVKYAMSRARVAKAAKSFRTNVSSIKYTGPLSCSINVY